MSGKRDTTRLLASGAAGDRSAVDQLLPLVYDELRRIAHSHLARLRCGRVTLQPTELVHEAYMKLIDQRKTDWNSRKHFVALAATAIRRVLGDHLRKRVSQKRGGHFGRVKIDDAEPLTFADPSDILAVDEAIEQLSQLDERQASIAEMRWFGGLDTREIAEIVGLSPRMVQLQWAMARTWLHRQLTEDPR